MKLNFVLSLLMTAVLLSCSSFSKHHPTHTSKQILNKSIPSEEIKGQIDKKAMLQTLERNSPKFKKCYQDSLELEPSTKGNLGMQWLVSPSGRGIQTKAFNNEIGSSFLVNCIAGVLERLSFPESPSKQTSKVKFTFKFHL